MKPLKAPTVFTSLSCHSKHLSVPGRPPPIALFRSQRKESPLLIIPRKPGVQSFLQSRCLEMLGLWALNLSNNFSSDNKREHRVQKAINYICAQPPWIPTFLLKWNKNPNPALRDGRYLLFPCNRHLKGGRAVGPLRALRIGRHPLAQMFVERFGCTGD